MTYLCTPYAHPDARVRRARFDMACLLAGALIKAGHVVYSPIAHSHPIAEMVDLPGGWEFWKTQDLPMVLRADRLIVAMMDGWRDSKGIQGEIEYAEELGIPVEYKTVTEILNGRA